MKRRTKLREVGFRVIRKWECEAHAYLRPKLKIADLEVLRKVGESQEKYSNRGKRRVYTGRYLPIDRQAAESRSGMVRSGDLH